jgi:hypothetical protein
VAVDVREDTPLGRALVAYVKPRGETLVIGSLEVRRMMMMRLMRRKRRRGGGGGGEWWWWWWFGDYGCGVGVGVGGVGGAGAAGGDTDDHMLSLATAFVCRTEFSHVSHPARQALVWRTLPAHMVPQLFEVVSSLPVDSEGAIDLAALPSPSPAAPKQRNSALAIRCGDGGDDDDDDDEEEGGGGSVTTRCLHIL